VTVKLLQLSGLARPLLTQCPSAPSPLLMVMAARQQWWHGAKMISNASTGGRVIGYVRIVASNTARIDLPMWLWSEPYREVDQSTVSDYDRPHIATDRFGRQAFAVARPAMSFGTSCRLLHEASVPAHRTVWNKHWRRCCFNEWASCCR